MKLLIGALLLLLMGSCTGYTIASLGSNILTYSATGKTNSDHVVSAMSGKDCRLTRALKQKKYCAEKNISIVENKPVKYQTISNFGKNDLRKNQSYKEEIIFENETIENIDVASVEIIKNDSNLITNDPINDEHIQVAIVGKVFTNIYYGTLTWAEVQITKGTRVSDKIGLTEDLTKSVQKSFNNIFNY